MSLIQQNIKEKIKKYKDKSNKLIYHLEILRRFRRYDLNKEDSVEVSKNPYIFGTFFRGQKVKIQANR